jgi:hypothetical protein
LRWRELAVDFHDPQVPRAWVASSAYSIPRFFSDRPRSAGSCDIGDAIDALLLIWAATEAEEWRDKVGYLPL